MGYRLQYSCTSENFQRILSFFLFFFLFPFSFFLCSPLLPIAFSRSLFFLGLDNAGKTSLLHRMTTGSFKVFTPTQRAREDTFQIASVNFKAWDLGGHEVNNLTMLHQNVSRARQTKLIYSYSHTPYI